jgi:putative transcriptional regulator
MVARRLERGWSQAELAARLGVSRQTVISIERRRFDPSLPLAFHIARAFACTIEHGGARQATTMTAQLESALVAPDEQHQP